MLTVIVKLMSTGMLPGVLLGMLRSSKRKAIIVYSDSAERKVHAVGAIKGMNVKEAVTVPL